MVLKPEPFFEAVEDLRTGPPIVLLSARGRPFGHRDAVRFAVGKQLTLLCGHYKDVDQRVADGLGAEELSVGDFVLSGGEPAALCVDRKSTRLNSSHSQISYAVFCLKKKKKTRRINSVYTED